MSDTMSQVYLTSWKDIDVPHLETVLLCLRTSLEWTFLCSFVLEFLICKIPFDPYGHLELSEKLRFASSLSHTPEAGFSWPQWAFSRVTRFLCFQEFSSPLPCDFRQTWSWQTRVKRISKGAQAGFEPDTLRIALGIQFCSRSPAWLNARVRREWKDKHTVLH